MNDEILKALGVIGGGIVATVTPYVTSWINKRLKKNDEAKVFIHNTEYRALINEVLVEIRATVGANRVSVVEYHNGNVAINGLPFNYSSMTYEKSDNTTREILMNYQKVPISPICELLLDLHNSPTGHVRVGQDYERESVVEMGNYYGVKTSYIFRIGDHIKYGTVHISWVNDENVVLTDEELHTLHLKVRYINELMNKMKKHP